MYKPDFLAFFNFHRSIVKIILVHELGQVIITLSPLKLSLNHRSGYKESITILRILMLIIHLSIVDISSFFTDSKQLSSALYSTLMNRLVIGRLIMS
jgi:hypothetical protein